MKLSRTRLCTLRLDSHSGDLIGLRWKRPSLELIHEPRLGENFRLLLPKPGREANYFESRTQRVTRVETGGNAVTLVYEGLRNEHEKVDVTVRYSIRVADAQLEFSIEIENRTNRKLAEVFFGIIGGNRGIHDRTQTRAVLPDGHWNNVATMFQQFAGGCYGGGNLGLRHSAMGWFYPTHLTLPWFCAYNEKRNVGCYYANQDLETRLSAIYFELRPFTSSATVGENWPRRRDVPRGEPIGMTMGWLNMPYAGG